MRRSTRVAASGRKVTGLLSHTARLSTAAPGVGALTGVKAPTARRDTVDPSTDNAIRKGNPVPEPKMLDVRTLIPRDRHRQIFETYATLEPGESFVLVNDHDPLPLYYQFDAEHEGEFSWSYLEEGPTTWRVEIGRRAAA